MRLPIEDVLVDAVFRRYAPAGRMAKQFARGKLRHDPIYFALLRRGELPDVLRLLDLGCGQGLLLALLLEARELARAGRWPRDWPSPPSQLALRGIERWPAEVRRARIALGSEAVIEDVDLREAALGESSCITLIDVIHYLEPGAQGRLLARIRGALLPGGVLIMRVGDASARFRAVLTRAADHLGALVKGGRPGPLHQRSVAEWIAALESLGFSVRAEPMSAGTPFANAWLVARVDAVVLPYRSLGD